MKSFTIGNIRLDILNHVRVMGEDFPTSSLGYISEWFEIDCFENDKPLNLYPNQDPHPHPDAINRLIIGWVGRESIDVYANVGTEESPDFQKVGTKRGADFRTRFFSSVMYRLQKAIDAQTNGQTIKEVVTPTVQFTQPIDLKQFTIDDAILEISNKIPEISKNIPKGTVVNIDVEYDGMADLSGGKDDTNTICEVARDDGDTTATNRSFFRFSLASIPAGATVSDSDIQFRVASEVGTSQTVLAKSYNGTGDDDPESDSGATAYTRCGNGATLVTITTSSTGSKTGDLGTTGDSDIQGNISSPGIYSLALAQGALDKKQKD